jgi:peptidoglycan/xylan/chitin deacetylase (PgdA/CDA1 family)
MPRGRPPLVLAYHGIGEVPLRSDPHGLFVRPTDLRRHVRRLRSWGYRFLRFGELAGLLARGEDVAARCAFTFDDALTDDRTGLGPLLRELDVPATVFVPTALMGLPHPAGRGRVMTADEVADLDRAGVEIGSHSDTHRDLSALSFLEAREDLERSRRRLEEVVSGPVRVAAYPFGRATEETVRACREAGFEAACLISGNGSWGDPFRIPRQDMDSAGTMLGLRLKRDDRYEPLMRTVPGRAGRRLIRSWRTLTR